MRLFLTERGRVYMMRTQISGSLPVCIDDAQHPEITVSKAVSRRSPRDSFARSGRLECVNVLSSFGMGHLQAGTYPRGKISRLRLFQGIDRPCRLTFLAPADHITAVKTKA
jgi:hypothetical protein